MIAGDDPVAGEEVAQMRHQLEIGWHIGVVATQVTLLSWICTTRVTVLPRERSSHAASA